MIASTRSTPNILLMLCSTTAILMSFTGLLFLIGTRLLSVADAEANGDRELGDAADAGEQRSCVGGTDRFVHLCASALASPLHIPNEGALAARRCTPRTADNRICFARHRH